MIILSAGEKFVEILKYIFIAFVQGVAEILPISSSGHITLASEIVNINPSLKKEGLTNQYHIYLLFVMSLQS